MPLNSLSDEKMRSIAEAIIKIVEGLNIRGISDMIIKIDVESDDIYNFKDENIIIKYECLCDEESVYKNCEGNLREEAVTKLKRLHLAIITAFKEKRKVMFDASHLRDVELKSESEYKNFLKKNQDIYVAYIEVLEKRSHYKIEE